MPLGIASVDHATGLQRHELPSRRHWIHDLNIDAITGSMVTVARVR